MAKCASCGKFLAAKGGATCNSIKCTNKYHLACLLPETTHVGSDWQCPECKKKTPKGENRTTVHEKQNHKKSLSNTSDSTSVGEESCDNELVQGGSAQFSEDTSQLSQKSIWEELRAFMSELRDMRTELRDFRQEMNDLRSSLSTCNKRVDSLEYRLEVLENRPVIVPAAAEIGQLELTLARLKLDLNDRDQELLSSDLEITNLPEVSGENVAHTVGLVASKLGVTLEERDIVFAQRVGPRSEREGSAGRNPIEEISPAGATGGPGAAARGRRIVVRLARRALRDDLLRAARVRRGATSADLGFAAPPRRFFLNERLTKHNKQLFYRVREIGGRFGWKYMWTKRGRILARQADGKQTYCFRSEEDLERVFDCGITVDKVN